MRTIRALVASALLTSGAVLAIPSAGFAAAPTAPYTGASLNFGASSVNGKPRAHSLNDGEANFYLTPINTAAFTLKVAAAMDGWNVSVGPPTGATFTAGTTYQVGNATDATHGYLWLSGTDSSIHCTNPTGTLTVAESIQDPTDHSFTAFAGRFSAICEDGPSVSGEIRWKSSIGFTAAINDKNIVGFSVPDNQTAPATVTVIGRGSNPVTLGTPAVTGASAAAFTITATTCANAVLDFLETCTVTVAPNTDTVGQVEAFLTVPDNTVAGSTNTKVQLKGREGKGYTISPSPVAFGQRVIGTTPSKVVTVTSTGTQPVTIRSIDTNPLSGEWGDFTLSGSTCVNVTLSAGQSCKITITAHPTEKRTTTAALRVNDDTYEGSRGTTVSVTGVDPGAGTYYELPPSRILDTRTTNGANKKPIGSGQKLSLQVTGRGGVPATGVSAVVLNVTVTGPTTGGYLTVSPSGQPRPNVSSLNFPKGWTGANSVTVALGTGGKVDIFNVSGNTHVIADVMGYFASNNDSIEAGLGTGGQYHPDLPWRMYDSRETAGDRLGSYELASLFFQLDPFFQGKVKALAVNVTAVSPSRGGFLTVWNGTGDVAPGTSLLNFSAGKTVPNFAVVPIAQCDFVPECAQLSMIGIYNGSAGSVDVLVDLVGYFDDGTLPDGMRFRPITPVRIADTRSKLGGPGAIGAGATVREQVPTSVTTPDTVALAMNLTAVSPSKGTYLTVWPGDVGMPRPTVSNINPAARQTVPNASITLFGPLGGYNVYNAAGTTHFLGDVVGTYEYSPYTATTAARGTGLRAMPHWLTPSAGIFVGKVFARKS